MFIFVPYWYLQISEGLKVQRKRAASDRQEVEQKSFQNKEKLKPQLSIYH